MKPKTMIKDETVSYIGGIDFTPMPDTTEKHKIEKLCDALKIALLNRYEADLAETNSKLEKIKCHKALMIAKEELNNIRFN